MVAAITKLGQLDVMILYAGMMLPFLYQYSSTELVKMLYSITRLRNNELKCCFIMSHKMFLSFINVCL